METLRRSGEIEIHFAIIDLHFVCSKLQHHWIFSKTARVTDVSNAAMAALDTSVTLE